MSMLTVEILEQDVVNFHQKITQLIALLEIDLDDFSADHLALRVSTQANAASLTQDWQKKGKLISSNIINGRPIVVIKLDKPLAFGHWCIECVELPYPSNKSYPFEGWEHVEWVIPSKAQTVEAFLIDLFAVFPKLEKNWGRLGEQGISVKMSSPSGEGERLANPTIAFKYQGICVKLHPVSLASVIDSEVNR